MIRNNQARIGTDQKDPVVDQDSLQQRPQVLLKPVEPARLLAAVAGMTHAA